MASAGRFRCNAITATPHMVSMNSAEPSSCGRRGYRQSAARGLERAVRRAAVRPHRARAFLPAFERAFAEHEAEVAAIAADPAQPTFANTIEALERSGRRARRGSASVFYAARRRPHQRRASWRSSARSRRSSARHWNRILHERGAVPPHRRVASRARPARPDGRAAARARALSCECSRAPAPRSMPRRSSGSPRSTSGSATLGTAFSQNVLADEQSYALVLDGEAGPRRPAGLRARGRARSRRRARPCRQARRHAVALQRRAVPAILRAARSARKGLPRLDRARRQRRRDRQQGDHRRDGGAARRARAAARLSDASPHYRLDDAMAKTPEAVRELLERSGRRRAPRALADRDAMQALVQAEGGNFALAPWDWRYYAEKLRKARCDVDEATIKPYFQLDRIIEAAFYTANRLFGLSFERARTASRSGTPDVRVWEVRDADGTPSRAVLRRLFRARLQAQRRLDDDAARPGEARRRHPAAGRQRDELLQGGGGRADAAVLRRRRTLFHEFGHALHGLLSDVTYPMISGTSVLTDLVELPSQLYEHWLRAARRSCAASPCTADTGEPMPEDLLRRLLAARTFNQGFATVEYVGLGAGRSRPASRSRARSGFDVDALRAGGARAHRHAGRDRHAPPAAAFRPHVLRRRLCRRPITATCGRRCWTPTPSRRSRRPATSSIRRRRKSLHDHVYSAGGSRDPAELYTAFRGRLPTPDALLRKRGFSEASA